jgi:formylmethanofuran dehydrogenase subunit E
VVFGLEREKCVRCKEYISEDEKRAYEENVCDDCFIMHSIEKLGKKIANKI